MKGVIYKFTSPSNKVYIGQAVNEHVRYMRHKRMDEDSYFHRAINKYGFENFDYEVIATTDNKDVLDFLEKYYIKKYNAFGEGGYNLTKGGEGAYGTKHTEEWKQQMSERMKVNNPAFNMTDEWRENISKSQNGRKMSDEFKKKTSDRMKANNPMKNPEVAKRSGETHKGTHISEEHKQKISQSQKGKIVTKETKQKMKDNAKTRSRDAHGHFIKEDKL